MAEGSPKVAVGAYVALQNLYGMGEEISHLASPNHDSVTDRRLDGEF